MNIKTYEPLVVLALCALCGWLSFEIVGAMTYHGMTGFGLSMGMSDWLGRFLANPFFPYREPIALMIGVGLGVAPLAVWAVMVSNRGNFDPGKEHGDARKATKQEMRAMLDRETVTNNIVFTKNSGLVIEPKNDRHRKELTGRNHNVCCIGTSGTGKTAFVSKPMIMNSVGSALASQAPFAGRYPEKDPDEGYDFFLTDPKGDTLRDVGWFLAHAGVNVKVFDTINFKNSLKFNPLAYIGCYRTDIISDPLRDLTYEAKLSADDEFLCKLVPTSGLAGTTCSESGYYLSVEPAVESSAVAAVQDDEGDLPDEERRHDVCAYFDDPEIADSLKSVVYQRSSVTYKIRFHPRNASKHRIRIELALDDNLVPFRGVDAAGVKIEKRIGDDGKEHNWCVISIPSARRLSPSNAESYEYVLTCAVKSRNVADGVALTSMVDCLVANLGASKDQAGSNDAFWDDSKRLFFMSIIAYIIERFGPQWCNLPTVIDYIDLAKVSFDGSLASPLDYAFENWETGRKFEPSPAKGGTLGHAGMPIEQDAGKWVETGFGEHPPSKSLAVHCYKAFKQGAPETLQSIIISCQVACTKLVTEEVRWLLDSDEMKLDTLGEAGQRQAIFAIVSDSNPAYEFLLAIMQYLAINSACDRARLMPRGELPRHVHFILDEFANIGKLPAFDRAMAVVRSRNVSVCLFLQTMKQLDKVYGKDEGAIIQDCCGTLLFLGGQSKETLDMLSDLMGEETVDEINTSRTYGMRGSTSANRSKHQRKLATVSQLRTTPISKAWVMTIGAHPFLDDKFIPGDHPYFKFISGKRMPGQPDCVFPPFRFPDYQRYLKGEIALPISSEDDREAVA